MFDEFLAKVGGLRSRNEPFATAVVVRYEAPVSGKPGDKAVIFPDGQIWGWIGGGCAQPMVIREALKALADGRPRLVRISPSANPESGEGIVDYTMTCHSGGSLDIFIEPVLPKPQIVIFGRSVVAQTLAKLGKAIDYGVTVIAPGATSEDIPAVDRVEARIDPASIPRSPRTFVVVATQGEQDEEALEQAVALDATYVAFVASNVKAGKVLEFLRDKGIRSGRLERVRAPAGLQIGAISPEEIAVSILAEIVQAGRTQPETARPAMTPFVIVTEVKDPICGMSVNPADAKYKSDFDGRTFYFCCARCKHVFDKEPAAALGLTTM